MNVLSLVIHFASKSLQYAFLQSCSIIKKICLKEVCSTCNYLNYWWAKPYGLLVVAIRVVVSPDFWNEFIHSETQTFDLNEKADFK